MGAGYAPLDYLWAVDREAIARSRRRQQLLEALESERDREQALTEQLAEVVTSADGPRLDESVFERMDAEDASLVRDALAEEELDLGEEAGEFTFDVDSGEEAGESLEDEIDRLERELELCRQRQQAFERYLEALG